VPPCGLARIIYRMPFGHSVLPDVGKHDESQGLQHVSAYIKQNYITAASPMAVARRLFGDKA
jgi:hypothetical protein